MGRGRKGNKNERKKRQCPLPESIPGHKNTQTYYYYSFSLVLATPLLLAAIDFLVYV